MTKKPQKNPKKFYCKKCDFGCNNRKDYTRHLSTTKHKNGNNDNTDDNTKNPLPCFVCICGRKYKYRSGLSRHKTRKACGGQTHTNIVDNITPLEINESVDGGSNTIEMFNKVLKQNNKLMAKLAELSKERTVINYQNCNNKKMTINVFLNEQCKDAINLTDFVENVKVSLADLKYTTQHGYIKGISNIFVKNLQNLDPKERPIHCSDKKRLQFYVKDENRWKRDKNHEKIDKSIQNITIKQIKQVKEWERGHPNYLTDEKLLHEWHTMIQKIMGVEGDIERRHNNEQIKKSVSNEIDLKDAMIV